MGAVRGTARCLRPFLHSERCRRLPRLMSPQSRPVSSETRSPVCTPTSSSARSRFLPIGSVGRVDEGVDLGGGEERDDRLVEAFRWNGKDALDERGVLGVAQRRRRRRGIGWP